MEAAGLPTSQTVYQDIKINFYTNSVVKVK